MPLFFTYAQKEIPSQLINDPQNLLEVTKKLTVKKLKQVDTEFFGVGASKLDDPEEQKQPVGTTSDAFKD